MEVVIDGVTLSDDRSLVDFDRVHAWLTTSYWSEGITIERVRKAAQHSAIVVGGYRDGVQVAYCRVVTDFVRFAWLCDVFVDSSERGNGVGKRLIEFTLSHPEMADVDLKMPTGCMRNTASSLPKSPGDT